MGIVEKIKDIIQEQREYILKVVAHNINNEQETIDEQATEHLQQPAKLLDHLPVFTTARHEFVPLILPAAVFSFGYSGWYVSPVLRPPLETSILLFFLAFVISAAISNKIPEIVHLLRIRYMGDAEIIISESAEDFLHSNASIRILHNQTVVDQLVSIKSRYSWVTAFFLTSICCGFLAIFSSFTAGCTIIHTLELAAVTISAFILSVREDANVYHAIKLLVELLAAEQAREQLIY